jgi:hypothetical protein
MTSSQLLHLHAHCKPKFDRVQAVDFTCKIWEKLKVAHGGNNQVKACLFVTYWMEYENFTHLFDESIDSMLKDRLGDQRGGSEWEPIKILPNGRTRPMPQIHHQGFPHEFAKVA